MKRIETSLVALIFVVIFTLIAKTCSAQDYIITNNNDTIKCIIQSQQPDFILYKINQTDEHARRINTPDVKDVYFGLNNTLQYKAGKKSTIPLHHFCEIVVIGKIDSVISVKILTGTDIINYKLAPELIDAKHNVRKFTSFIDAVNFLDALGYKPKDNYTIVLAGYYEFHYVMYTGARID